MLQMKDERLQTRAEKKPVQNWQLRMARERRGWTQKELADLIDLPDARTIRRWECGEASPSLRYRARLCELFEMSPEELNLVQDTHSGSEKRKQPAPKTTSSTSREEDSDPHPKILSFPSLDRWNRQQLLRAYPNNPKK